MPVEGALFCRVSDIRNTWPNNKVKAPESNHGYRSLLLTGHWFRTIPVALQDWLLATASLRRLAAGERVFARGAPPCGLYAVVDGALSATGVSSAGKEALLTLIEPPHWFGEIALFDGLPRTHDTIAVGPATLLHIAQPALEILLREQPVYWQAFGLLLTQKLRLSFLVLEDTALLPAAVRLARRLLMIAQGYGESAANKRRVIALQQEQLAMMLSLSRQTTNQILQDLGAHGVVRLARGEIEILDLDKLRAAATALDR
jgi:CRP/FNR family transcriptional regulator, cyclic AMP receptor protein